MVGGSALQAPLSQVLSWMNLKLGWLYLGIYIVNFVFLIGLAFSRYGKIKIGKPDDKPIYSGFKWGAMVFATAIDASIMMLSITDPLQVIQNPPFHFKAYSHAAYLSATMMGQFNWPHGLDDVCARCRFDWVPDVPQRTTGSKVKRRDRHVGR